MLARAPDGATTVIHANLNASLGKGNQFTAGYGVAVDAHGDIFTDMDASVFSSVAAIVEVQPNGYVRTLWKLKELG